MQGFTIGNNGQKIVIDLRADGENVNLNENCQAFINIELPSGKSESKTAEISNGTVVYTVTQDDISEDGFTIMQVKLTVYDAELDDSFVIYTPKFALEVA